MQICGWHPILKQNTRKTKLLKKYCDFLSKQGFEKADCVSSAKAVCFDVCYSYVLRPHKLILE